LAIWLVVVPDAAVGQVGVPVNAAEASGAYVASALLLAFPSRAVCVAVLIGRSAGARFDTLPNPTLAFEIPVVLPSTTRFP
jgi:hypothetical protein